MMADVDRILKDQKFLYGRNSNWRSYFEDLASFCLPRKSWITTPKTTGERLQFNFLYDSVAMRSLKIMAAGFHSNLTNPSTKWFSYMPRKKTLRENLNVMRWCKDAEEGVYSIMNNSNFDTTMQEFYMDGGCFGTGSVFTEEHPEYVVCFKNIPIEQLNIVEDSNGKIIEVFRSFKLTPTQAYRLWGEKIGKDLMEALANKPYEDFEFLHYVGVRSTYDASKVDNINKPIASVWIALKGQHEILESGFDTMPFHIGRFWKDPTDPFGYSPAMDVLADIKLLNQMKKTGLRRAMKETDPPLSSPDKGFMLPLNLNPAAINYRRSGIDKDAVQAFGFGAGNFTITQEMMGEIKAAIEEGFFVPLFRALSQVDKEMTVPEVQRRIMENMVLLGPTVGRYTQDVLEPMNYRVLDIAVRRGVIDRPPQELAGEELEVLYLSPLAKAQKESELISMEGFLTTASQVAQFKPDALDVIDGDKVVKKVARIRAVDPDIFRNDQEVDKIRSDRLKQQQAAQQAAMAEQMAGAAANAGKAKQALAKSQQAA